MSKERHLHVADEIDAMSQATLKYIDSRAEDYISTLHSDMDDFFESAFDEIDTMPELVALRGYFDAKFEAIRERDSKYNFLEGEPRWKDGSVGVDRPVLLHKKRESINSNVAVEEELITPPKMTLDEKVRFILGVPDGEDTVEFIKAIPWNVRLELRNAGIATKDAFSSIGEHTGIDSKSVVRAAAAITAFGVLASSVAGRGVEQTEQAMGPDGIVGTELIVKRTDTKASIPFNSANQEIAKSEKAAEELLGVEAPDVVIKGDEIEFSGKAEQASDEALIAATMEAQRPDVAAPEITPEPKVQEQKLPTTPEEKFSAEVVAIENALKHAVDTGGDLGPLNHLVAYSPIFQPRYDLPGDLENGTIKVLPPANLLNIDGLKYEFSQGAPDKERMATTATVALTLATAYAYNQSIAANPEYSDKYGDSCIRVGDLSADKDHKSHFGSQVDMTSSMQCDVIEGHEISSGPVFWINHTSGGMDQNITNPNHNEDLDNLMLQFMTSANINGQPVVGKILYSKPNSPDGVAAYANHSNHIHVNALPRLENHDLKGFADGGERPERNLDQLRGQIFSDYDAGVGVEGISKQPTEIPAKHEVSVDPAGDYMRAMEQLLSEIAAGEGGWDSVNRDDAGDTKVGDENYVRIFGGRKLSELTIAELRDLQDSDQIFAIGRYQFIPKTFKSAIESTGIDTNRVFNPETQNELAVNYLILSKRPNLANYIKGESADLRLAIDDLCKEFASIPCTNQLNDEKGRPHGSGYYDGDSAGNNAHGGQEKIDKFALILINLREAYKNKDNPVVIPEPTQKQLDLVLTGDSLTVGLDENHANIASMDTEFGVNVVGLNARGGRALSNGEDNGMDSIEGLIASGAINQDLEAVYLAYGTNYEKAEQFEANLRKAIARIGEVSDAQIVMPLIFSEVDHAASRNEIINRVAQETGAKVINPGEGLPLGDGLHPGPDGYKEMAKRILKEVSEMDFTPEPLNPAPTPQPSTPAELADSTKQAAPESTEVQDPTDSTTTTQDEQPKNNESTEESASKEDEIWFNKQSARNVYEVWFTEKIESDNGELVTRVDEEALNEWMANNVQSEERNGQTVYKIDFSNTPERK